MKYGAMDDPATREQKFLIYRLLVSIGIRKNEQQFTFLSALLNSEFDADTLLKGDATWLIGKLNQIIRLQQKEQQA